MSVVVPVRNNAGTIDELTRRIARSLDAGRPDGSTIAHQVVMVDDASDDASWRQIVAAHARDPRVLGLRLAERVGQMAAIVEGVRAGSGELVLCIDADLECRPEDLVQLVERLADGADLVSSTRIGRERRPLLRRIVSGLVAAAAPREVRRSLDDIGSGMKGWRRSVSEPLLRDWDLTYMDFVGTMVASAPRIDNVEVQWRESATPSGYGARDIARLAIDLVVTRTAGIGVARAGALGALSGLWWGVRAGGGANRSGIGAAGVGGSVTTAVLLLSSLASVAVRRRDRTSPVGRPRVAERIGGGAPDPSPARSRLRDVG